MDRAGDRPNCKCHDKPMRWHKNLRYRAGGSWRCAIKERAYHHTYNVSEKGRARARARRERRLADGECVVCRQPRLSDRYCWDCLSKKEDARALSF